MAHGKRQVNNAGTMPCIFEISCLCFDMKRFTIQLWCHMAGQEQGPAEKVLETALKSVNDAECQILLLGKGGT